MAIKQFLADIGAGDETTADIDLIFKIYGSADSYVTPIITTGSHASDANVGLSGSTVTISNVEVGSETTFKISSVDEAANESILSPAFVASANKALEFLEVQTDQLIVPCAFLIASDFYFEMRFRITALGASTAALTGSNTNTKMQFGRGASNDEPYFLLGSSGGYVSGEIITVGTWYTMKTKYDTSETNQRTMYLTTNDGVNEGTDQIGSAQAISSGLVDGNINMILGKFEAGAVDSGDWEIDWIDANGIVYNFDEIVAGQVLDSNDGNALTITTDRADVNDMLVTV